VAASPKPSLPETRAQHIPIGPRLAAVLELAYRARRPALLEGPTGIGKSDIVKQVAAKLGIAHVVLDLSLLEPPDLVGLPVIHEGRTRYAPPDILPQDGAGILMLEELNRAERYIQQPALQLLSARRLHGYELPPGWACFAAINPEGEGYHVTPLDRALRARFMHLHVRADRASFLAWALMNDVHPGIIALAQAHERILDEVPPRSWAYASEILKAATPEEIEGASLLRDALAGYLPPSWIELLIASRDSWHGRLPFDVRALLADYEKNPALSAAVRSFAEAGKTDRLDELTSRLCRLLEGPETGVLAGEQRISLSSFEGLIADLPGDQREKLQESLGKNPTATGLILKDIRPEELIQNYQGSAAERRIAAWRADPIKQHRIALVVTALSAHLKSAHAEVKRSNVARACLGLLLTQLPEKWALDLVAALKRLGITPIRPA